MNLMLLTLLCTIGKHPGGGGEIDGGEGETSQRSTLPSPLTLNNHQFHVHTYRGWSTGVKKNESAGGFSRGTESRIQKVRGRRGVGVKVRYRVTPELGRKSSLLRMKKRNGKGKNFRRKTNDKWKLRRQRGGGGEPVANVRVVVGGTTASPLPHFWRSTGLSPPLPHASPQPFLLSPDERLNLALVGSLPHDGVSQVRIHWLLDLVNATLKNGSPLFNFTQLDLLMTHLHRHRLRPGFELMGNPGGIFSDFENATQTLWWRHLVEWTAARYVDLFGLDWVSSWRWETWNEPDHHDFDNLNFTEQGFLNYFDACREGLLSVSPRLRLGGPGASCRQPAYSLLCWALLDHCNRRYPARCLDFLSVHKKGQEDADSILTQELLTARLARRTFPNLRHVPLVNDEGDFLKGWWRGLEWRADSRYAALVARAVAIHLPALAPLQYELLSFDNAFLNYRPNFFDQRTLVARFQMNSSLWRHVQLVKKPAYTMMGLLTLLGDRQLRLRQDSLDDRLSVIASCRRCSSSLVSHVERGRAMDPSCGGDAETSHELYVYSGNTSRDRQTDGGEDEEEERGEEKVNEEEDELEVTKVNKNREERVEQVDEDKMDEEEEELELRNEGEERKERVEEKDSKGEDLEVVKERVEERNVVNDEEQDAEKDSKDLETEEVNGEDEEELEILQRHVDKEGIVDDLEEDNEESKKESQPNISPFSHSQHDSTVNLETPQSHRNIRHAHTYSARKQESTANTLAFRVSSVVASARLVSSPLPLVQTSRRRRFHGIRTEPSRGGTLTAASELDEDRFPAVFPLPEGRRDGMGGKNGGASVEGKERKVLGGDERQENTVESQEGNEKRVWCCEGENVGGEGEDRGGIVEMSEAVEESEENQNENQQEVNDTTGEGQERKNNEIEENERQANKIMEEGNQRSAEEEELEKEAEEEEESEEEPPGGSWEATVLVSLSDGPAISPPSACSRVVVALRIPSDLVGGVVLVAVYRLGDSWPGPYEAWLQLGRPEEPSHTQLAFMRGYEDARRQGPRVVSPVQERLVASVRLCVPDVWVLHVCEPSDASPGQVVGVSVMGVTLWDALVTWSDERINTRCVLTYEVEQSIEREGPYERVNRRNVTDNNFWYSGTPGLELVVGWYRVRVVTYWGATGPYSDPVYHP